MPKNILKGLIVLSLLLGGAPVLADDPGGDWSLTRAWDSLVTSVARYAFWADGLDHGSAASHSMALDHQSEWCADPSCLTPGVSSGDETLLGLSNEEPTTDTEARGNFDPNG